MYTPRKRLLTVLAIVAVLLCAAAILAARAFYRASEISMSVVGDREITLYYGENYTEQGAEAAYRCSLFDKEPIQLEITITGKPDTQKVGNYYIKYTATYGPFSSTRYRLVRVMDQNAPVIDLITDPAAYTLPNAKYEEEGFTAWDEYDGDLTHKVHRTVGREYVTYTVMDSSGNRATVKRRIRYDDPIPPELTVEGNSVLTIFKGQEYFEPGYTATDNVDGDITGKVQVDGFVDPERPGQYEISYTVTDNYNNSVSAKRVVRVMPFDRDMVIAEEGYASNGKVIYLTFDDGPSAHTPRLLDILKKYNVKATFFVTKTKYIDTIKRAAEEGHTVAVHSASHKYKSIYASEDAFFADMNKMQSVIEELTGQKSMILRFPGGSSNTVSKFNKGIMTRLVQAVTDKGYRYFDWNVDSNDAGGAKTADKVFNNVVKGIGKKTNAIVLQHDTKGFSVDAVEQIILWGLVNGYRFEALNMESPNCEHVVRN